MDGSLRRALQFDRASAFDPQHMLAADRRSWRMQALLAVGPWFGMMVVAAVVAPLMLGGWMFSTKAIAFNAGKLNPLAGIGRMFSAQSLAELVKALAKSALIGGVAWWVVSRDIEALMALMAQPARYALPHAMMLVAKHCALIAATLFLVALIDVPFQLWSYYRKLRMSREDLRQEHKESEGDPHIKAQIRRQQQADGAPPHDGRGAQGRHRADQPHALRGGAEVPGQRHARAARGGQGHRAGGRAHPRAGQGAQRAHPRSAAAGALALQAHQAGARDSGGPVHGRGRGAGLGLPAQALEGATAASSRARPATCRCPRTSSTRTPAIPPMSPMTMPLIAQTHRTP
jgi:hypothetical protein